MITIITKTERGIQMPRGSRRVFLKAVGLGAVAVHFKDRFVYKMVANVPKQSGIGWELRICYNM